MARTSRQGAPRSGTYVVVKPGSRSGRVVSSVRSEIAVHGSNRRTPQVVVHGSDPRPPDDLPIAVGTKLEQSAELIGRAFARTAELMAGSFAASIDVVLADAVLADANRISLDASRLEAFSRAAEAMSMVMEAALQGVSFTVIVGDDTLMTSQEAAALLNVSRPYVIKLAREGRLAHQMVGTHHRFTRADVLALREQMRADRTDALRDLVPDEGYQDSDF